MNRSTLSGTLLATLLTAALAGCGSDTATDSGGGADTPNSPSASPTGPTGSPTVGSYPEYPHDDYSYTLRLQCFCASFGKPIRITVTDDQVTSATWARNGRDTVKGEEVTEEWARVSLDDVIAAANDTEADVVEVDWPAGADHPTRVSVDRDLKAMDEEITYVVSDVQVSS
jgi:hypothetical protein